jgi:hypothetical protein
VLNQVKWLGKIGQRLDWPKSFNGVMFTQWPEDRARKQYMLQVARLFRSPDLHLDLDSFLFQT